MSAPPHALDMLSLGLCVLPAMPERKRPSVSAWKQYESRRPDPCELDQMWNGSTGTCIVTGAVSGHLEMIDFDGGGELYQAWANLVDQKSPGLLDQLVIETSPSGGKHVVYRCEKPISGSVKLAQRRGEDGRPETLIETRGEGGLFLCDPSPGYRLEQGSWDAIPTITAEQRNLLLGEAWSLNDMATTSTSTKSRPRCERGDGGQPGDDYNRRGDVRALLDSHGWTLVGNTNENELWRRPGKTAGHSATMRVIDGMPILYVFSSNAYPFEPSTGYRPLAVFAMLECGGDYSEAARRLREMGFGGDDAVASDVDLSAFEVIEVEPEEPAPEGPEDPGEIPLDLLRCPGFISELMDHTIATAPVANPAMAFCGALALQSVLGARKVQDQLHNRTNLYILALAPSGYGKDYPRKINAEVLCQIGMENLLLSRIGSGEGLEDHLCSCPTVLVQTDEIDGLLLQVKGAIDYRYQALMDRLKELYTSSDGIITRRALAGRDAETIHQPSVTLLGSAVRDNFYGALSERLLSDGFFSRLICIDAGREIQDQEPERPPIPPRVIETAAWWANLGCGGNLSTSKGLGRAAQEINPDPRVVAMTPGALAIIRELRSEARAEQTAANDRGDVAAGAIWARAREQARRLALVYAISERHEAPSIGQEAVQWAADLTRHLVRRMLYMASTHVSTGPFHDLCLKFCNRLRRERKRIVRHSTMLRHLHVKSRDLEQIVQTLTEQGDIETVTEVTKGRGAKAYRLR